MWINHSTEYDVGQKVILHDNDREYVIDRCELEYSKLLAVPVVNYWVRNEVETIKVNEGEIFHARTTLP